MSVQNKSSNATSEKSAPLSSDAEPKKKPNFTANLMMNLVFVSLGCAIVLYCANSAIRFSSAISDRDEATRKGEEIVNQLQRDVDVPADFDAEATPSAEESADADDISFDE